MGGRWSMKVSRERGREKRRTHTKKKGGEGGMEEEDVGIC